MRKNLPRLAPAFNAVCDRLEALEAWPALEDRGVFQAGKV